MRETFVLCKSCGEQHNTSDVEFLDIEEDIQGHDVMTFRCPTTEQVVKGLVFSRR